MDRKRLLVDVEQVVGWFKSGEEVDEARVKVGIETLAGAVLGLLREEAPPGVSITRARWEVEAALAALSKVGKIQGGPADTATRHLLAGPTDPGPVECPKADPWAIPGQVGLVLADVAALATPVHFRGAQGFFDVPDDIFNAGPAPSPRPLAEARP